jgi:ketosteroid isomerase-like protein
MTIARTALLALFAAGLSLAADSRDQVSDAEKALVAARSGDDASAMDRLTDEDFLWVRPDGRITSKKQLLEDLKAHRLASYKLVGEQRIRIFGNTAVVTGERLLEGTGRVMVTNVWVNKDGRWQRVSSQTADIR